MMVAEPFQHIDLQFNEDEVRKVRFSAASDRSSDEDTERQQQTQQQQQVTPSLRHGVASDKGRRQAMEDSAVAVSCWEPCSCTGTPLPSGIYAVFDGHNGSHAAEFASERILHQVTSSQHFPADLQASLGDAFLQIDRDYLAAVGSSSGESAGTTALTAVVWGDRLYVANAGDSRAVLSRCGRAIELTKDHKPAEPSERQRIELCGGFVCAEGLLCGELAVARAIGDYHLPELKGCNSSGARGPLIAEPEVSVHELEANDEFMLLGCDGLWDVFPSQRAVEFARARLRDHNDPQRCAEELVAEALRMHSSDNVTVIAVCFSQEAPKKRVYGNGRFSRSVSREALSTLAQVLGQQQLS